jgi:murein DD-endopeptidase MepM/ murein hydrolase activator NlpD
MSLLEYKYFDSSLLYKPSNNNLRTDYTQVFQTLSDKYIESMQPKHTKTQVDPGLQSDFTLKKGDKFKIGDTDIIITDPFGIRNFEGREGKHSTGLDLNTSNKKAIAIKDGIIESVRLEGDGSVTDVTDKDKKPISSAGYYVVVKHDDGTRMQYMHLNRMSSDEMKKLKGVKLKRGDNIWGYDVGSGSMTGPHFKVRWYTGSSPLNSYIDPSSLLIQ